MQTAGNSAYRNRLIIDTGSTDHICNDLSKFTSFGNDRSYHAIINTGAGPIHITRKGTIAVTIATSNGETHTVTFSEVLYAPDMFVSVLSHSKLRAKDLYYHGWQHKLLRAQDDIEVAFAPEIDGIPTLIQATDEVQVAEAFAFAAVNTAKPSSTLAPSRKVSLQELHQMFGHADVAVLKQLVNNTTGLQLTHTDSFSCEVCHLNKAQKNISRRSPNRSPHFLHRVHVDIVGPVKPRGLNGEQYWIIYTDDYSRYRWIDVIDCKAVIQGKFLQFLQMAETQYNVRVAIVHTDNDTVLVNRETRQVCINKGTVFETSTPHTQHQNGVAEASNRIAASRSRSMLNGASHLPKKLWPLAAEYSIDLMNHTPTASLPDGKTPRQLLLEHMKVVNTVPNLSTVRTFGEPGYVHTPEQRRTKGSKFEPRAERCYFVGRQGSRIYLMWHPRLDRVTRTSSVTWATYPLTEGSAHMNPPGPTKAT
jgi:hypothetical protein